MSIRLFVVALSAAAALSGMLTSPAAAATTAELLAPTSACSNQNDRKLSVDLQEQAMRCMVDFARTTSGLAPLPANAMLMDSADRKARDIVSCQQFSHTACGLSFTQRITDAGYAFRAAGENIAWGTGSYGTVRSVMSGWLSSSGHKANLLSATYREQGIALTIGTLKGRSGTRIWVNQFAAPR